MWIKYLKIISEFKRNFNSFFCRIRWMQQKHSNSFLLWCIWLESLMTQLDEDKLRGKEEGRKEKVEVVRYRCRKERQLSLEVIAQIIKRWRAYSYLSHLILCSPFCLLELFPSPPIKEINTKSFIRNKYLYSIDELKQICNIELAQGIFLTCIR